MDLGQPKGVGRKRRRLALACIQCRKRKLRCDRATPCSNCVRSKGAVCLYSHSVSEVGSPTHPVEVQEPQLVPLSAGTETTASRRPSPPPTVPQLEAFRSHNTAALDTLTFSSLRTVSNSNNATTCSNGGQFVPRLVGNRLTEDPSLNIVRGNVLNDPTNDPVLPTVTSVRRAVVIKTRYLGPSHWIHSSVMFPRLFRILEKYATPRNTEIRELLANGKRLARKIKHGAAVARGGSFGPQLPSKDIADKLFNAYLRTFERVYRILHVPSFQMDYDHFWMSDQKGDKVFIIKLQLCLAIGACFYDETFSLRSFAMQWINEAQLWLAAPISEKSNMTISGLQIMCLLHIARETTGVNADMVWISSGALLRAAMYMGLHRDPTNLPPMSYLQVELRRRLWSTILELVLQSSIASGGLPLFSMDDFDTAPPANLDDEQLMELENGAPEPKPPETLTDTSFLIILRNMLAVRLDITNLINNFRDPPSYEDTLRHNAVLVAACRELAQTVHFYQTTNPCPSIFQIKLLELLTHRFLIALHMPFMERALQHPVYYFSRRTVVKTSLKLYRSCCPAAVPPIGPSFDYTDQQGQDDYVRLCICGSGPFRNIIAQAQMMIAIETISQLEDDVSLGDSNPSIDLLHAVRQMRSWTKQRLYSGETNIKSHMCVAAFESNVNALLQGLGDDATEQTMTRSILESLRESNDILESCMGQRVSDIDFDEAGEMEVEETYDEGWVWDALFFES